MEYITVTVSLMGTTRLLSLKRITELLQKLAVLTSQQADALLNWKSLKQMKPKRPLKVFFKVHQDDLFAILVPFSMIVQNLK